jgi:hypothetical protein
MYRDILVNEILPTASSLNDKQTTILNFASPYSKKRPRESPLNEYSSTLCYNTQKALQTPKKLYRYISKTPFKVLDAPELQVITR